MERVERKWIKRLVQLQVVELNGADCNSKCSRMIQIITFLKVPHICQVS